MYTYNRIPGHKGTVSGLARYLVYYGRIYSRGVYVYTKSTQAGAKVNYVFQAQLA